MYDAPRPIPTRLGTLMVHVPQTAPQLVLWPGVFHDSGLHRPLAAELGRAGVGAVLIEPPGFGGSEPISGDFSMADCGMAMVDVVRALGQGPMVVGGTSWGGATAAWAALGDPSMVRAAVMMNAPYDRGHRKAIAGPIPTLVRWTPPLLFAIGSIPASLAANRVLSHGWSMVRTQHRALSTATARCRQTAGKRVFWHRESLFEPLQNLQVPALVIAGELDQLCPVRYARRAAEAIPQHELWLSPDTGHLTAFEAPEATARRILEFMDTLAHR